MIFLYPVFLWALFAVAIPVIIHLFNFRKYKKVYFSNVRFLREIQLESKSKSRLREILVLILRSLAIAALVFAFSQPFIPQEQSNAARAAHHQVSVYIDNSFSMENVSSQGPLLQIAIQHAKDLAAALDNNTDFQLITNDFEGKHQRLYPKENFIRLLDEVKISATPRKIEEVLDRQTQFLQGAGPASKKIFLLTDLQKSSVDFTKIRPDTNIQYTFLPLLGNRVDNISLDSCWFDSPIQQKGFVQHLNTRIKNHGQNKVELGSAKLILNGQQVAISTYSLEPESETRIKFSFANPQEGFNYGQIKIEDYPVTFDDQLFFAFDARIHIRVLVINGKNCSPNNPLVSLLTSDSIFQTRVMKEEAINFAAFKETDALFLNGISDLSSGLMAELQNFTAKTGVLVIIPPQNGKMETYNSFLPQFNLPAFNELDTASLRTEQLQFASTFYQDVFEKKEEKMNMPLVNKHYLIVGNAADAEVLIRLQNSDPFFVSKQKGNTRLFLFASSFEEKSTNFSKHALFVPTVYKMAFEAVKRQELFYTAGSNVRIPFQTDSLVSEEAPHIKSRTNSTLDVIPEIRTSSGEKVLYTRGQITEPGYYVLSIQDRSLSPLAFNYARSESDLNYLSTDELSTIIEQHGWKNVKWMERSGSDLGKSIALEAEGKKLWKLFLILAIVFLLLEVAVLRLFK